MKLGVFSPVLASMSFKEMVEYLSKLGVQQLEMGAGGYPGKAHFDPEVLLKNDTAIDEIKGILKDNNMSIAAISCHGNPVHPKKEIADKFHNDFNNAVLLAEKLQQYITDNFYTCTKEILSGLGEMYVLDERFRENMDKHGEGTAEFVRDVIRIYCR